MDCCAECATKVELLYFMHSAFCKVPCIASLTTAWSRTSIILSRKPAICQSHCFWSAVISLHSFPDSTHSSMTSELCCHTPGLAVKYPLSLLLYDLICAIIILPPAILQVCAEGCSNIFCILLYLLDLTPWRSNSQRGTAFIQGQLGAEII